jgi:hypothetical protein
MDCLVAIRPALKLDLGEHPGQRWEGRIDMLDNGDQLELSIIVTLHFAGPLFEGHGKMSVRSSTGSADISISGQIDGASSWFDLWVDAGDVTGLRLDCIGSMDAGATLFEGECSYVCGKPDTCACGGGRGPMKMWKLGAG